MLYVIVQFLRKRAGQPLNFSPLSGEKQEFPLPISGSLPNIFQLKLSIIDFLVIDYEQICLRLFKLALLTPT